MKIAIGSDHAGFALKERIREALTAKGHEVKDFGTDSPDSIDYPDFAAPVAKAVSGGDVERGVLVCYTGVGMSIAANKVRGVRAALGTNSEEVGLTRRHNDANVLTIGARYTDEATANELVDVFLSTDFEGGRHQRRVSKMMALEGEGSDQTGKGTSE
jgi:ribose 5-phosphate isomerase B